ncbi:hypothetical protein M5689_011186 [Euphorbia peplus]|nr:hypothetical protein M5689_011186 [Euphorbia peplus]
MVKRGLVLKGLVVIILLGINFYGFGVVVEGSLSSGKKILEARKKTNHQKSLAVKSIQSEDGDIIDCIDMYKQPAFAHPSLRNHTIQMAPSYDYTSTQREGERDWSASQVWKKNGSCPMGTIPIRRYVLHGKDNYGRKKPSLRLNPHQINKQASNFRQSNRSVAILLTEGYSYSGVKGDIKVWNPYVESDQEWTTSQISLKSGSYSDYESLEFGWAVNPSLYGDKKTRLFLYWTADGSKTTGCFDLTCPGFVQTSNEVALGAAIYALSVPFGLPSQITLYIFKDPNTNNWWVQYGEKISLGYWPSGLFSLLAHGNAEGAEWGGEVYSSKLGSAPHTKTGMGNGEFPDGIFGNSGTFRRLRVRENPVDLKFPEQVFTYQDEYNCYRTYYVEDYTDDPEFYYGGPGKNPMCP